MGFHAELEITLVIRRVDATLGPFGGDRHGSGRHHHRCGGALAILDEERSA